MLWFWKKKEVKFKLEVKRAKQSKPSRVIQIHLPNEVLELRLLGYVSTYKTEYSAITGKKLESDKVEKCQPEYLLNARISYRSHPDCSAFFIQGKNSDFYTFPINNQTHTYPKEMIKKIVIFDGPEEMVEVEVDEVVPVDTKVPV